MLVDPIDIVNYEGVHRDVLSRVEDMDAQALRRFLYAAYLGCGQAAQQALIHQDYDLAETLLRTGQWAKDGAQRLSIPDPDPDFLVPVDPPPAVASPLGLKVTVRIDGEYAARYRQRAKASGFGPVSYALHLIQRALDEDEGPDAVDDRWGMADGDDLP